jgi:hypothetical protein
MLLKLPYPTGLDVTTIAVNLTSGIDGNGVPNVVATYSGKCRYVEKAKTLRDPEGKMVRLEAKAYIGCDIAPLVTTTLRGNVTINGESKKIYRGYRPRNPDGTVHHTELELI